ncbi:MAG: toll/interleukin-1 receptor domain-containing protein [Prevotella sp.]|jgi:hypothetical protein|nr:toll/interleukin-1 receptor domain-containing protein [Prevotella sp.]
MENSKNEIYISYAWEKQTDGTNWSPTLNELYKILTTKKYEVSIDIKKLKYKDSIKSFMQKLGQGKFIILLITDKYMRSINCMYEIVQILRHPNYKDRVFPIIFSDAKIYDSKKIIDYLQHWDLEINELNNKVKALDNIAYAAPILEDLELMNEIRRIIANFSSQIGDMNVLNIDTHIETEFCELLECLEERINEDKKQVDILKQNAVYAEQIKLLEKELDDIKIKYSKSIALIKEKELEIENLKEIIQNGIQKKIPQTVLTGRDKLLEFQNLLGFSRNTTKDDIIKILGNPEKVSHTKKYDFNIFHYNNFRLTFYFYEKSEKLMAINIEDNKTYLKKMGFNDDKINYLGKHLDLISSQFGEADSVSSGFYTYTLDDFIISFICYDFNNYKCSSIQTQFFRNNN